MRLFRIVVLVALGVVATPAWADQPSLSEPLQKEALTCATEAVQICPDVWTAEDHGVACLTGKRGLFSPRCQAIYDKVDHALHPAPSRSRSALTHDHAHPPAIQ